MSASGTERKAIVTEAIFTDPSSKVITRAKHNVFVCKRYGRRPDVDLADQF
jgi:hypothetical protein